MPQGLSRSAWWLSAEIVNAGDEPLSLVLLAGPARLQYVDFHILQPEGWQHTRTGSAVPMSEQVRAGREPQLALTVAPGARVPILIRTESAYAVKLRPRLYTPAALQAREARAALWDGVQLGGILALGWCGLLIFAFTRSLPFAWLGTACVMTALFELTLRGYTKLYLWPEAIQWGASSSAVLGLAAQIAGAAFVLTIAKLERYALPALRAWFVLCIVQFLLMLCALFGDLYLANTIAVYSASVLRLTVVLIALLFVWQQAPTAKLMLLTATFALLNFGLRVGEDLGLAASWLHMDIHPNPVVAILGLAFNLVVLTAWICHVAQQRKAAQSALVTLQQTEQDRLREEVARQTTALNEALLYAEEKGRHKTQALGYISHDLRAPLATIAGYTRLLDKGDARQAEHIQAIERSVGYQLDLIDELLEYTKEELQPLTIAPAPTGVPALLEEIASYAKALCADQYNRFTYAALTPLPANVLIDGRRLQQVLLNLLSNAAKFTYHGHIRLNVEAIREADAWLLRFSVSDDGIGIDIDEQTSIFDAFRQLQRAQGGVGLGLYIVQHIVQGMGAELRLRSAVGQGSTFSFQVRVQPCDEEALVTAPIIRLQEPPTQVPARILDSPPADRRLELAKLARDGRLSDIETWLDGLEQARPGHTSFYDETRRLLDTLDFERIETLALSGKS